MKGPGWWCVPLLLLGTISPACSCDETDTTSSSTSSSGGSGTGGSGGSGTGGASTTSSSAGGSGTGGSGSGGGTPTGQTATNFVNAGEVAQSANYRMVFTLGQSTQNQGTTTSPSYRMQGGLIGATGTLP